MYGPKTQCVSKIYYQMFQQLKHLSLLSVTVPNWASA